MRTAVLMAIILGALVSLALMFFVGGPNRSTILLLLFTLWVLTPYAAFAFAVVRSKRWSPATVTRIFEVILVLMLAATAVYAADAFGKLPAKPAFAFLIVPLVSNIIMVGAIAAADRRSRRRT